MRRSLSRLAGATVAFLALATAAQADRRVALVIGNGAYAHVEPLANPTRDARAMRDALARLGFEVVYGEDLDLKRMGQKVGEFAALAQQADVALTYYAGHGSTFDQTSYLVPVDAEYKSVSAMSYELMPLEKVVGELRQARGVRIAIIDACRDNRRERELKLSGQRGGTSSRGLGRVENPQGLILAFATQYGQTAADGPASSNSPFTAALLKWLPTPGLDVKDVFYSVGRDVLANTNQQQRPAIEISFYDRYALVPSSAAPSSVAPEAPPASAAFNLVGLIAGLSDKDALKRLAGHNDPSVAAAARNRLAAVNLLSQPETPPELQPQPDVTRQVLGLNLSTLSDEGRKRFGLKDTVKGVLVTRVAPKSTGDKRIQPGDLIVEVGQEAMSSPEDVIRRLDQIKRDGRKSILFLVANKVGEVRFLALNVD